MNSINNFNNKINEIQQDKAEFEQELKNKQNINKENNELKQTMSNAIVNLKGGDKKAALPQNPHLAYIEAMVTMMDDNTNVASATAEHMNAMSKPMDDANKALAQLDNQNKLLAGMSSPEAMLATQEINAQFSTLNTDIGVMGTNLSQDSGRIKYAATQSNATAGNAAQTLDFIHKAERIKHL